MAHGILNTTNVIRPEDEFICEGRETVTTIFDKTYKNYVDKDWNVKGASIVKGKQTNLKRRDRVQGNKLVNKKPGRRRRMIKVRDYRHYSDFDRSAYRVRRGKKVPCTPYPWPAHATAQKVTIAEGEFHIAELNI